MQDICFNLEKAIVGWDSRGKTAPKMMIIFTLYYVIKMMGIPCPRKNISKRCWKLMHPCMHIQACSAMDTKISGMQTWTQIHNQSWNSILYLWSKMRVSALEEELTRDSDNIFNLSTCNIKQSWTISHSKQQQEYSSSRIRHEARQRVAEAINIHFQNLI